MEKLTIKEASAYLPFDVTFEFEVGKAYGDDKIPFEMRTQTLRYSNIPLLLGHGVLHLRSLSQLTDVKWHFIWDQETDLQSITEWISLDAESRFYTKFSYAFWQLLYENHFDVFSLIDKGLAIEKK